MRHTHLNVAAIRASCRASQPAEPDALAVTRRQMLGLSAVATVSASPALKLLERFGTRVEVRGDARRVAFLLDGTERWVIDPARFAGSPALRIERREGLVRVSLTNARYPGTDLSADLVAELRDGLLSTRLLIRMRLGRFHGEMAAEKFLSGAVPMRSSVVLGGRAERLGNDPSVTLGGRARAEYRPDWSMRLHGSKIASLTTGTGRLLSNGVVLALLDPEQPSAFTTVSAQRTRLTLRRGEEAWPLDPLLSPRVVKHGATPGGILHGTFDAVNLELSDQGNALIAEANGAHAALTFRPDGSLLDMDGEPFAFPLQNPRYVRVFAGSRRPTTSNRSTGRMNAGHPYKTISADQRPATTSEWALVARFHENPVWLRDEHGFAIEIGDADHASLFEFNGSGSRTSLTLAPAVLHIVTPIAGAVTRPTAPHYPTRLNLHHSRVRPRLQEGILHIRSHPAKGKLHELYAANLTVSLLRPHDLLSVTLEFTNATLHYSGGPGVLVPNSSALIVHFPPQHFGEQAFYEDAAPRDAVAYPTDGHVQIMAANPSRLGFSIPGSVSQIPYTVQSLLDWSAFTPVVSGTAAPIAGGNTSYYVTQPLPTETSIEAPYRLALSPNSTAGWAHSPTDVTHGNVTELWHTRLGVATGGSAGPPSPSTSVKRATSVAQCNPAATVDESGHPEEHTVRAIWSPDISFDASTNSFSAPPPGYQSGSSTQADPYRMSLDSLKRYQLVRLTADYGAPSYTGTPAPVSVDRLMLSSLGAWMDIHGVWNTNGIALSSWRHRMTMGRDTYVRTSVRGYLYPFGHLATLVTETERQPYIARTSAGQNPTTEMVLLQYTYIVIQTPERVYDPSDYFGSHDPGREARRFPYARLRITTLKTPTLDEPGANGAGGGIIVQANNTSQDLGSNQTGFWPTVNGQRLLFHLVGEDLNGNPVELSMPLLFLSKDVAEPPQTGGAASTKVHTSDTFQNDSLQLLQGAISVYAGDAASTVAMNAQAVAMAPQSLIPVDPTKPVDPAVLVNSMTHSGVPMAIDSVLPTGTPNFFPVMPSANISLPSLQGVTGQVGSFEAGYHDAYLDHALDAVNNPGQMFLNFTGTQPLPRLDFTQNMPGLPMISPGLATPSMDIRGVSAALGAAGGDPTQLAQGIFDPYLAFGSIQNTKILGVLKLRDLIGMGNKINDIANMPRLVKSKIPDAIDYTYSWSTEVHSFRPFFLTTYDHTGDDPPLPSSDPTKLTITATVHAPLPTGGASIGTPTYQVQATLNNFALAFEVIALSFKKLQFTIESEQKFSVVPDVGEIEFFGALSFLEAIKQFMAQFLDPPYLDVKLDHIEAGYTLSVPNIPMGAWTFQNVKVGAGIFIPFFGDPLRATFDFGTRADPFLLTVEILGGGGHFGLALSPRGVETIEASVELGASVDINLVICEAAARVMLGIDVSWNVQSDQGTLIAFYDVGCTVTLLELLTVGLDIQFGLGYDTAEKKFAGEAMIQIEVGVSIFTKTITIGPVRKDIPIALKSPIKPPLIGSSAKLVDQSMEPAGKFRPHVQTSGATIAQILSQDDWTKYCRAFA